jgi:hypothetical protein
MNLTLPRSGTNNAARPSAEVILGRDDVVGKMLKGS